MRQIAQHWADGVDYIEDMLRKQLIAAIGKEVCLFCLFVCGGGGGGGVGI